MALAAASPVKNFSGEIRRDFKIIMQREKPSAEKLTLILKHTEYQPSEAEIQAAMTALNEIAYSHTVNDNGTTTTSGGTCNAYSINSHFRTKPVLQGLSDAIEKAFTFKDKYTEGWRLVYALIGYAPDGRVLAEFGVTEKDIEQVAVRLASPTASKAQTKVGRFLADVEATGTTCYLFQLECHHGDLDDAGFVKDWWKLAGLSAGVKFPQRGRTEYFNDSKDRYWRVWPPFDMVMQHGVKIR